MKRLNINRERETGETGTLQSRALSIRKLVRRRKNEAGAGILALVVLHFVSQFIFFPEESFFGKKPALDVKNEQTVQAATEAKTAKPDAAVKTEEVPTREAVHPVALPRARTPQPSPEIRKKEVRESKSERLRRAERLLTGA